VNEAVSTVLQEVRSGHGVGLAAVAREFPGQTGRVNPSTVFRWTRGGARANDGSRIKLESIRLGSKILTSWPAVERFVQALSAMPSGIEPTPRSPAATRRASEQASAELIAAGC
jgi:hypothetical protein